MFAMVDIDMWPYVLTTLGLSLAINMAMSLVAFRLKTDKLTDISYAVSFVALALVGLFTYTPDVDKLILFSMIALWALRLGGFLLARIWAMKRDTRFDGIREDFWKFARFWVAQGVSVWVILLPALLAFGGSAVTYTTISFIGMGVWGLGLAIEATADLQKRHFSQNPANKDKWIATGLWRYSRHPNYFGEMLVWIGLYLFVLPSLSGVWQLVAAVGPLFIVSLLLFVSGVPPLEKSADARWGKNAEYQKYKRRTSPVVLLPPKPD